MAPQGGKKLTTEERIQALLKKAETTTPEEAKLLTAKAEELMLKYGIDQALLNSRSTGEKERIEVLKIPLKGIYAKAYMDMMVSIARAYGEVNVFYTEWKNTDLTLTVTGFESTVAQLKVLLESLQIQCVIALTEWWKSNDDNVATATAMQKFKARRSFIKNFGDGAAQRIRRARASVVKTAESSTPGTELMLRDRQTMVDEFVASQFGAMRKVSRREKPGGFGASSAGYRAGQNANTGDKQVGNQRALNA